LASTSARLNASGVLMSGLGAPLRTATPAPEFASAVRAHELALLDQVIHPGRGEHRQIEGRALLDLGLQRHRRAPGENELVPSRLLEPRRELLERRLQGVGADHLDLGGARPIAGGEHHAKSDRGSGHRVLLHGISYRTHPCAFRRPARPSRLSAG
jgi:hypothetical protein